MPGKKAQSPGARCPGLQDQHPVVRLFKLFHPDLDFLLRYIIGAERLFRLQHHVGDGRVAAGEDVPQTLLGLRQGKVMWRDFLYLAGDDLALALAAVAIAATVIERQSTAQAAFQNGIGAFYQKFMPAGQDANLGCHYA